MKKETIVKKKKVQKVILFKRSVGKPTVMTEDTFTRLEYAFAIGASKKEAAVYAKISESTLFKYLQENPDYALEVSELMEKPIFLARQAVIAGIIDKTDRYKAADIALKYLTKKKKDEFGDKVDIGIGISSELVDTMTNVKNILDNAN